MGVEILLHTFTMSALDGSEWAVSRPCQFNLGKGDTVPTVQGAGWSNGAVRIFGEKGKCVVVTRIEPQNLLHVE